LQGLGEEMLPPTLITPLLQQSYWQVVLTTGRRLSEMEECQNINTGAKRPADWTLDLLTTGDIMKVKELCLIYPGWFTRPAILKITEPGTCFQFKTASAMALGAYGRQMEAQTIGRILNKEEGTCECFTWDRKLGLLSYASNIHNFGTWDPGRIAPIGALSQNVIGLKLG
jgi:hypothetical protein